MRRLLPIALLGVCLSGCAIVSTTSRLQSTFVFPQANVLPQGHVEYEFTKQSLFYSPQVGERDIDRLVEGALAKSPGANALIDFTSGSRLVGLPPLRPVWWRMTIFIRGTAAKVEDTGYQNLESFQRAIRK